MEDKLHTSLKLKFSYLNKFQYYNCMEDTPITVSGPEIIEMFYSDWKEKMLKKYSEEEFRSKFSFDDCIYDFCVLHCAYVVD